MSHALWRVVLETRLPVHWRLRVAAYLWAAPNTMLGLVAGGLMVCLGGQMRWISGVAEFHGGRLARVGPGRFAAVTLGHAVLGRSAAALHALRSHERIHVWQYERWGPLFLPAYAASGLWQALRGRCAYRDNFFERQARGRSVEP